MAENLHLSVRQSMRGERRLIVETLNSLAGALQSEVNKRGGRPKPEKSELDAAGFLQITSAQLERLAGMFAESEAEFQRAVGPEGSPKLYIEAYGHMLEVLGSASDAVVSVEAPAAFRRTQQAFLGLAQSIYDQVAGWPRKMREAATKVLGDSFDMHLTIDTKATAFQRALEADVGALGLGKSS